MYMTHLIYHHPELLKPWKSFILKVGSIFTIALWGLNIGKLKFAIFFLFFFFVRIQVVSGPCTGWVVSGPDLGQYSPIMWTPPFRIT